MPEPTTPEVTTTPPVAAPQTVKQPNPIPTATYADGIAFEQKAVAETVVRSTPTIATGNGAAVQNGGVGLNDATPTYEARPDVHEVKGVRIEKAAIVSGKGVSQAFSKKEGK